MKVTKIGTNGFCSSYMEKYKEHMKEELIINYNVVGLIGLGIGVVWYVAKKSYKNGQEY